MTNYLRAKYLKGGPYRTSPTDYKGYTREDWLLLVLAGMKVQPPDWWLRLKTLEGLTQNSATNVWHSYFPSDRYVLWDKSSKEDFVARGYYRE